MRSPKTCHAPSLKHFPCCAEVPEFIQKALQQAQAMGVESQGQSQQQQHSVLPPRVLRLQQYSASGGEPP